MAEFNGLPPKYLGAAAFTGASLGNKKSTSDVRKELPLATGDVAHTFGETPSIYSPSIAATLEFEGNNAQIFSQLDRLNDQGAFDLGLHPEAFDALFAPEGLQ